MPDQAKRIVAVASPLGDDVLVFQKMTSSEQLGRMFSFDLDLLSEDHGIGLESVLGERLTIRFERPDQEFRYFDGYVSQFAYRGSSGRFASYQARLSPWFWFLTRRTNCRIFQNKTVPDIIKQVFQDHAYAEFEDRLRASYPTWDYCVQYRESDFDFVSRLMEHEGIYYFFKHQDGTHTLILADGYSAHEAAAGYEQVPFYPPTFTGFRERDHLSTWSVQQEVQPGTTVLRDFDFEKPKANLETRLAKPFQHARADLEVYDYPGIYLTSSDGDTRSRVRLEERHAHHQYAEGSGDVAGLGAGGLFSLTGCPRDDQNREYLVTASTLHLLSEEYESAHGSAEIGECAAVIVAIDSQQPFRPARLTPKPFVQGPQTAIVTGPGGEEIWTDKYGRVKVQFHWDRGGKNDENSSCWVRVSHPWAGKNWGAVAIPRIGQEVIVDFLEGDPDRPIITGRVYNADTMPPYGLPGSAVISGLKSDSTKGGGGYNEYVMDDTKGNELIREHGQFDKDSTIEHDLREHVLNNRSRDVTVDETVSVGNNQTQTIGVDQTEHIGNNQTYSIGTNQTGTVGANRSTTVAADDTENVGANQTVTIGSNKTESIGIIYALTVGAAMNQAVGAALAQEVGGAKMVEIGGAYVLDVGAVMSESVGASKNSQIGGGLNETVGGAHNEKVSGAYVLKADQVKIQAPKIVLVAGGSKITMDGGGVSIKAPKISVNGSGNVSIKAGGSLKATGATIGEN